MSVARILTLGVGVFFLLDIDGAMAAIYKCIKADGTKYYQEIACPEVVKKETKVNVAVLLMANKKLTDEKVRLRENQEKAAGIHKRQQAEIDASPARKIARCPR